MTNRCDFYKSTELNAPPVSGQAGSVLVLLNGVLVDGFNRSITMSGITRSGTTATATVSAADGLKLRTGNVITISGCTGADASLYNGTFTITVASTTTFTYTMTGTPTGSATGSPVGTTQLPVTSIVRFGNTAVVTMTVANSTLPQGLYVTMSGAAQSAYNGDFAINVLSGWAVSTQYVEGALVSNDGGKVYVNRTAGQSASSGGPTGTSTSISDNSCSWDYVGTNQNVFSYAVAGSPTTPATGTIVYWRAGLQWTRPFAGGTNSQVYRSADAAYAQHYCQIVDTGTTDSNLYGAENMTGDQAGITNQFPTTAQFATGLFIRKATAANTTVREWTVWGDDRFWACVIATGDAATNGFANICFGAINSYVAAEGFGTIITGNASTGAAGTASAGAIGRANALIAYMPRAAAQTGTSVARSATALLGLTVNAVFGGATGAGAIFTYPHPTDNGLLLGPMYVLETANTALRGIIPGVYAPFHVLPFTQYDETTGVDALPGRTFVAVTVTGGNGSGSDAKGQILVDKFGPW